MTATDTGALIKKLREHARFHDREAKISGVGSIGRMWHNDDAAILRQAADELDAARARIAELEKDAGRLDLWAHIDTIREAVCDAKAEAKALADLYQGYKRAELYVEWHEKYSELLRAIDAAMADSTATEGR